MKSWLSVAVLCAAGTLVAACGGGGGGGGESGSSTPSTSIAISTNTLTVTALTIDPAPTAQFQILATNPPAAGLYASVLDSASLIASGSISAQSANVALVSMTLVSPASLGVGTHSDRLTVTVCLDQACAHPVNGSPQIVELVYTVNAPPPAAPVLSSVSPNVFVQNTPGSVLSVFGSNFDSTAIVNWNGTALGTSVISSTQLTATVPASLLAVLGNDAVTVSAAGGDSNSVSVSVVRTPLTIGSLLPPSVIFGTGAFTLTVNGVGFDSSCVVQWNGAALPTTFVSATQLTATVPATDVESVGTPTITVLRASDNYSSESALFYITPPTVVMTNMGPWIATAGDPAFTLTVLGSGFNSSSVVQWNGSARPTTVFNSGELSAAISASDVATVGNVTVTVANTTPVAETAIGLVFQVIAPTIDATNYQINAAHTGVISFKNVVLPPTKAWMATLPGIPSYPLIANGRVYLTVQTGATTSQLLALDQATGAVSWPAVALNGAAGLTYDGGYVIAASNGNNVVLLEGFDGTSGAFNWSFSYSAPGLISAPPTALNGRVFFAASGTQAGTSNGTLFDVDDYGGLTWTATIPSGNDSMPTVTDDGLYLNFFCSIVRMRPLDGVTTWTGGTGCTGSGGATSPVVPGTMVAATGLSGFNGNLIDPNTGNTIAAYQADTLPALTATTGYFLQSGTLRAIDLSTQSVLWSFSGDGHLVSAPIVVNQTVFVGSSTGAVFGVDASAGTQVWQANVGAAIPAGVTSNTSLPFSGMAAGDGLLVVPAGNTVTAFVLSTSP